MLPRMRTIRECIAMLRSDDPQTALTEHALRCMVKQGTVPAIKIGNKNLINYDMLCAELAGNIS